MKKLILFLLMLSLCLSGCDVIGGTGSNGTDTDNNLMGNCGHYVTKVEGKKEATCTVEGYTGNTICYNCDALVKWGEIIEKAPHKINNGVCTYCGEKEASFLPSLPSHTHSYVSENTAPTCVRNGYTTYTCSCGGFYAADKVEPLGHSFVDGECSVCGEAEPTSSTEGCDDHEDEDNNGYCDVCSAYVVVVLDIFAINDLHGKISKSDSQPGIGGLTTYLKSFDSDSSILLSSGDMWQGTAESNLTYGAYITDWMSELGFVSMTLGNHEYDWGDSYIASNSNIASFPFLAINIFKSGTSERVDYAAPSVVIERSGVQIGIIGAIGDCYSSISGDVKGNYYFKTGSELTALVKAESERLRANGVDFIIYSLHDGSYDNLSYYDEQLSNGYVDLVFEGHSHSSYSKVDRYGVLHLQAGGENKGISYAKVSVNSANGSSDVDESKLVYQYTYSSYDEDPIVDELLDKYNHLIERAYEVLGTNSSYLDDSDIEQMTADLYYQFGLQMWGELYDITLGGGFIRTRSPYNLKAGTVTYADVYSLLPFDNYLVLCSISGRDLKSKFINTNNDDYYICGDNISTSSIKDNATYYIITDTYTSSYASNRLTEIARYDANMFARDLFAEYIRQNWN